jgi:hypothetical protein
LLRVINGHLPAASLCAPPSNIQGALKQFVEPNNLSFSPHLIMLRHEVFLQRRFVIYHGILGNLGEE